MGELGATGAMECGPGNVLAGLARRTTPQVVVSPLGTWADVPEARHNIITTLGVSEWAFDATVVGLTSLLAGLGTALMSLAMLAYYADCRVRRDGIDLRMRLADLAGSWTAGAPERALESALSAGGAIESGGPHERAHGAEREEQP